MAGLREYAIAEFYRLLHLRGVTAVSLARQLGFETHTYVSRMVTGYERHGERWEQLQALLTERERKLLAEVTPKARGPHYYGAPKALLREAQQQRSREQGAGRRSEPINTARIDVRAFNNWRHAS